MTIEFPSGVTEEVFAWFVLLWTLSQYSPLPSRPRWLRTSPEHVVRGVAAGVAAVLATAGEGDAVLVALVVAVPLGLVFPRYRAWAVERGAGVAWEIGVPAVFVAASAVAMVQVDAGSSSRLIEFVDVDVAGTLILLAAIVYSWVGGSRIVSGVLDRLSIPTGDANLIAPSSLKRGELIGRLERLLLVVLVAEGAFTALAFLIAAKGFVRSKEFDDNREFAEYFLIGTLVSLTLGLVLGLGAAAVG